MRDGVGLLEACHRCPILRSGRCRCTLDFLADQFLLTVNDEEGFIKFAVKTRFEFGNIFG